MQPVCFTVVVHPAKGQYHPQEQAHRDQKAEVLQRAQPDELQHDALRKLVDGRPLQYHGDLVGEQNDQQDRGHDHGGHHHFPQNVAREDFPQP